MTMHFHAGIEKKIPANRSSSLQMNRFRKRFQPRSSRKFVVRHATARKKQTERQVCANVSVDKGEGVVKVKDVLLAA